MLKTYSTRYCNAKAGKKDCTLDCVPSSLPLFCPELVGDKEGLNQIVQNDSDHFIPP